MDQQISIIGMGKMGMAIAKMLAKAGYEVYGYDTAEIKPPGKIEMFDDLSRLLAKNSPVIVAVKPQHVASVLASIKDPRLVISVAAGISCKQLETSRTKPGPTIRVMPNTPLAIKEGVSALYSGSAVTDDERAFVLELFSHGGEAFYIDNEELMHIVTAISGSGPAFVELFIQTLEDAGVLEGLPRNLARRIALQTVAGTARMVMKTKRSAQEHIHDVTSPGGTTIAGLKTLKDFNFERALLRGVHSTVERSRELGKIAIRNEFIKDQEPYQKP